jgi:hypothetical protein
MSEFEQLMPEFLYDDITITEIVTNTVTDTVTATLPPPPPPPLPAPLSMLAPPPPLTRGRGRGLFDCQSERVAFHSQHNHCGRRSNATLCVQCLK